MTLRPLTDWRSRDGSQTTAMQTAYAAEQAAQEALQAANDALMTARRSVFAWEASIVVTFGPSLVAVSAGPRVIRRSIAAALVGDRVYVHEEPNVPDGVIVHGSTVETAGNVRVKLTIPVVAIGATLNIPIRLQAYRTTTA